MQQTTIDPDLATQIGLRESIVLREIEALIEAKGIEKQGIKWIERSIPELQKENFPFWPIDSIYRLMRKLIDTGFLKTGQYNRYKWDKTKWYTSTRLLNSATEINGCSTTPRK